MHAAAGLLLLGASLASAQTIPIELFSPSIPDKLLKFAANIPSPMKYPQWTKTVPYDGQEGQWQLFPTSTWTSGFFPASLMLLNERFGMCPQGQMISSSVAQNALDLGRAWSAPLTTLETNNTVKHDVGFVSFPFWEDLNIARASGAVNQTATDIVVAFGEYLAGRYNPTVGCTRSWDNTASEPAEDFQVIIDNMINIELFYVAGELSGNATWFEWAQSHATKTMLNHIRDDGSTYHLVVYNSTDGSVIRRVTSQGYADDSTWSRGQAWAMYGFTSMYNRTSNATFLDTARKVSQWYLDHLPKDNSVPYWDFNAPLSPVPPRDTSSATIAASALIFLAQMENTKASNSTGGKHWLDAAYSLLDDTVSLGYRTESNWQAILSNGTSNNPANPPINNTGLAYGDYYFIKAGNMLLNWGYANCSAGSGTPIRPWNGTSSSGSGSGSGSSSSSGAMQPAMYMSILMLLGASLVVLL